MDLQRQRLDIINKLQLDPQKVYQSFLRADTDLGTQSTIEFQLLKQQKGTSATAGEKLLNASDSFIMTHLGLKLYKSGSSPATTAQRSVAIMYEFVNTNTGIFDGTTGDDNLQGIYNSFLTLTVNEVNDIPAIPCKVFERVPESQQGTVTTAFVNAASADTTTTIVRDGLPNSLYGFIPITPVVLNGEMTTEMTIRLPSTLVLAESSETNTLVLWVYGFLAINTIVDRYKF
ncbi:MAG: hypothetical protein ACUZ8H_16465 [Candidatus Anammoxibacter sp.]